MGVAQELPPRQRQGLLSQISYVRQLLFDKGDLPNRIQRAREIESMTGEDQRIPASVQEFLIPKAEFGLLLQEIVDARMNEDERGKDRAIRNIMDYLNPPEDVVADMEDFKAQEGQAGVEEEKIKAIAISNAPGLAPCLLAGMELQQSGEQEEVWQGKRPDN